MQDPLAALSATDPTVSALVAGFSLLAVATSFIGFTLGLTDFIAAALDLPSRQAPLPYLLALAPPFGLAVAFPDIFLTALDSAGEQKRGGWVAARCVDWLLPSSSFRHMHCWLLTPRPIRRSRPPARPPSRKPGTYGVLTLFGVLPCAMVWSKRYGSSSSGGGGGGGGSGSGSSKQLGKRNSAAAAAGSPGERTELVPGGKLMLVGIAGLAAAVVLHEISDIVAKMLA